MKLKRTSKQVGSKLAKIKTLKKQKSRKKNVQKQHREFSYAGPTGGRYDLETTIRMTIKKLKSKKIIFSNNSANNWFQIKLNENISGYLRNPDLLISIDKAFEGKKVTDFEIEIRNNKQTDIQLTLVDRIPITQNKSIKLDDIETGTSMYDKEKGILKWIIKLDSGETDKVEHSYSIKYPKGKRVNI